VRKELERRKWEGLISLPFKFQRIGERVKICGLTLECDGKSFTEKKKKREKKGVIVIPEMAVSKFRILDSH